MYSYSSETVQRALKAAGHLQSRQAVVIAASLKWVAGEDGVIASSFDRNYQQHSFATATARATGWVHSSFSVGATDEVGVVLDADLCADQIDDD